MNILLIQPNAPDEVNKEYVSLQFPINLGSIASVLIKANYNVKLIDFNVMHRKDLKDIILEYKPDMVGLTAMTSSIYNAGAIISEVKKINKQIITVLGGVHASALPKETMEEIEDLNYLVFGEGEKTIVELVNSISNNKKSLKSVKGILYRDGDKIVKNPPRELIKNLDEIPLPARHLIDMKSYAKSHVSRGFSRKEMNIIELMTSRGCPNQCIFCAGHINYGHCVRFRSYQNIVKEIKEAVRKYKVTHVSIEDDTFTINRDLVVKLSKFFKRNKITWNCNARVNTVDYNLLRIMKEGGCKKIAFGIESGSSKILNKIKKGITVEQAIQAVKDVKKSKIRYLECDFMLGSHPDETLEDIEMTEKLIYVLMPDFLALSIMCPYPGTELYNIMIKKKYLSKNPDWSQFSHFGDLNRYRNLRYLTSHQMADIQKKIMREYYSSPRFILSQIVKIRTFNEVKYFFKMGILFLKEFIINKKR